MKGLYKIIIQLCYRGIKKIKNISELPQVMRNEFSLLFTDLLLEFIVFLFTSTEKISVNLLEIISHPTNKIVPNQIIPDKIKM